MTDMKASRAKRSRANHGKAAEAPFVEQGRPAWPEELLEELWGQIFDELERPAAADAQEG